MRTRWKRPTSAFPLRPPVDGQLNNRATAATHTIPSHFWNSEELPCSPIIQRAIDRGSKGKAESAAEGSRRRTTHQNASCLGPAARLPQGGNRAAGPDHEAL